MAIESVRIRASIVGAGFNVETPNILSFYVRKSRGELSTFNFSAKINSTSVSDNTGGNVSITVNDKLIYTGIVTSIKIRPCFEDPTYAIADVSGTDVRKHLEHKMFTRRVTNSNSSWVLITGVTRPGLRSQKLNYNPRSNISSGLYLSPDTLFNSGITDTSTVKDYIGQSSGPGLSSGTKLNNINTYANVLSSEAEGE